MRDLPRLLSDTGFALIAAEAALYANIGGGSFWGRRRLVVRRAAGAVRPSPGGRGQRLAGIPGEIGRRQHVLGGVEPLHLSHPSPRLASPPLPTSAHPGLPSSWAWCSTP